MKYFDWTDESRSLVLTAYMNGSTIMEIVALLKANYAFDVSYESVRYIIRRKKQESSIDKQILNVRAKQKKPIKVKRKKCNMCQQLKIYYPKECSEFYTNKNGYPTVYCKACTSVKRKEDYTDKDFYNKSRARSSYRKENVPITRYLLSPKDHLSNVYLFLKEPESKAQLKIYVFMKTWQEAYGKAPGIRQVASALSLTIPAARNRIEDLRVKLNIVNKNSLVSLACPHCGKTYSEEIKHV